MLEYIQFRLLAAFFRFEKLRLRGNGSRQFRIGYAALCNVLIEDNDFSGNLRGSVLNNATSFSGFVIRNNAGQNPGGVIPSPVFPSSGTTLINTTGYDVTLYIMSGTQPIAIAINGTTLTGVLVPAGGGVGGPIRLPANQNITLTYAAGGAPSWQWVAD